MRVLAWRSFKPGAFGGFAEAGADEEFDRFYTALTSSANWCCSGGHWDTGAGFQRLPVPKNQLNLLEMLLTYPWAFKNHLSTIFFIASMLGLRRPLVLCVIP